MATHSSVLAWRIPGMGEPGGLPCLGSHRVGHDLSDLVVVRVNLVGHITLIPLPNSTTLPPSMKDSLRSKGFLW